MQVSVRERSTATSGLDLWLTLLFCFCCFYIFGLCIFFTVCFAACHYIIQAEIAQLVERLIRNQ